MHLQMTNKIKQLQSTPGEHIVGRRTTIASRLTKRLEKEFDCKIESIESNHRSKWQAAQGVWSWCATKVGGGIIGSEDTMTECLYAKRLHPEPHASSWPSFRDTHVTAVPT